MVSYFQLFHPQKPHYHHLSPEVFIASLPLLDLAKEDQLPLKWVKRPFLSLLKTDYMYLKHL